MTEGKNREVFAGTMVVVGTHLTILIFLLLFIMFFPPIFGEQLSSASHVPSSTQFILDASGFCRTWSLVLIPIVGILAYLDAKLFSVLQRKDRKTMSLALACGPILALSGAQFFSLWALFWPWIRFSYLNR